MNKIFGAIIILFFSAQLGFAAPLLVAGKYTRITKDPYGKTTVTPGGLGLRADFFNPFDMEADIWNEMIKKTSDDETISNEKKLFSLDDKGFIFLGENLPDVFPFKLGVGDLVLSNRLIALGNIYSPTISELKEKNSALEKRVEKLEGIIREGVIPKLPDDSQ